MHWRNILKCLSIVESSVGYTVCVCSQTFWKEYDPGFIYYLQHGSTHPFCTLWYLKLCFDCLYPQLDSDPDCASSLTVEISKTQRINTSKWFSLLWILLSSKNITLIASFLLTNSSTNPETTLAKMCFDFNFLIWFYIFHSIKYFVNLNKGFIPGCSLLCGIHI